MSNKPFAEKRDMDKGFKESRLFLNKRLSTLVEWNEDSIIDRANFLKQSILPESRYLWRMKRKFHIMFHCCEQTTIFLL